MGVKEDPAFSDGRLWLDRNCFNRTQGALPYPPIRYCVFTAGAVGGGG